MFHRSPEPLERNAVSTLKESEFLSIFLAGEFSDFFVLLSFHPTFISLLVDVFKVFSDRLGAQLGFQTQ
jgi:hypothetical protein